ncbi:MAG: Rossmann-like and DUF2520 domain-containing protein [Marinifilaceae bacterium]
MNVDSIQKIVFIGAGNLATHLSQALFRAGLPIAQVYSRTESSARSLAERLNARCTCSIDEIDRDADLYFLALSDKALVPVLEQLKPTRGIFLHTAGSLPMKVLQPFSKLYGVFYPLQTFSKKREVDFSRIPVCVEACNEELKALLLDLGRRISDKVSEVSSEQRGQLHLAAVFTCNFTNHMYSIGQELLQDQNLDFEMLQPLIMETAAKVQTMEPRNAQTGPAIRFDEQIIKKQEAALKQYPIFQKLYRFVSESIHKMHSKN